MQYKHGNDNAALLTGAILNNLFLKEPANDEARQYLSQNRDLIRNETLDLLKDPEILLPVRMAFSAELIYLGGATGNPLSTSAQQFIDKAQEFDLEWLDTVALWGGRQIFEIADYAENFLRRAVALSSVNAQEK